MKKNQFELLAKKIGLLFVFALLVACSTSENKFKNLSEIQKNAILPFSEVNQNPEILLEWGKEQRVNKSKVFFKEVVSIAKSNEKEVVAILISLLDAPEQSVHSAAAYHLRFITQENFKFNTFDSEQKRKEASVRWQQWWATSEETFVAKTPEVDHSTLIADEIPGRINGTGGDPPGRITHLNSSGDTIWQTTKFLMPYDVAQNTKGNYWVSLIREHAIWEIQPNEEVVNKIDVGGYPCSLQLLKTGNILVAGWLDDSPGFVREYNEVGDIVWEMKNLQWPWKAERLKNGNTLIADAGINRVFEVDSDGKEVWAVEGLGPETPELFDALGPIYCQRLDNGNTLISIRGLNKIIEVNYKGETVWEVNDETLLNQYSAVRLWNGNTLICDAGHFRVIEIDIDKNVVWKLEGFGYPAKAYRY